MWCRINFIFGAAMNIFKFRFMGCCLVAACLAPVVVYADTYTINDYSTDPNTYFGGTITSAATGNSYPDMNPYDTVGNDPKYDVDTLKVTQNGSSFSASLTGQYFTEVNLTEIIGDLFLSNNGWNPYSTGPTDTNHRYDTASNGETWEYVLKILDGPVTPGSSVTSGQIGLYAVTSTGQIVTSDKLPQTGIYRADQEVQYDPNGEDYLALGGWELDPTNGTFTFTLDGIDLAAMYGINLQDGIGLHWTMSCGNDVVEGLAKTPEPATMLLFGAGLSGLVAYRRRAKK